MPRRKQPTIPDELLDQLLAGPNAACAPPCQRTAAMPQPTFSGRSARGIGASLVLPAANARTMTRHLTEISSQVAPGAHAVVVMDGAGWHQTGGKLRMPANVIPLRLPPYAPELNPVENVWAYLRFNKLANRIYETHDDILDACTEAWNWVTSQPERITAIASRP